MIIIYFLLSMALLTVLLVGFFDISRFLRSHSSIDSAVHLSLYKELARRNMYAALSYIGLAIPWIVLGMYLIWTMVGIGFLIVLSMSTIGIILGIKLKKIELQVRSLKCRDKILEDEYQQIGEIWQKKALPNF